MQKMVRSFIAAGILVLFMSLSLTSGITGSVRPSSNVLREVSSTNETSFDGPDEEWNKTFGDSYKDWFGSGIKTIDGIPCVSSPITSFERV